MKFELLKILMVDDNHHMRLLLTEILRARFKIEPIYPATRSGANGTRVNFYLVRAQDNEKVLVELVEQPKGTR